MNRTNELFKEQLTILNVGAPNFREDLKLQGQRVTQIKWQPPMDGDQELLELLDRYSFDDGVAEANRKAVDIVMSASPVLTLSLIHI